MREANLPSSFRLPAARKLEPLQQGELDGLCGIYSLINAMRLVRTDSNAMRRSEIDALFSFAVHRLAESGDLRERLSCGVPWAILKRIGRRMVTIASEGNVRLRLTVIPREGEDRLLRIQRALLGGGAMIASIHNDEHYSVIVGWTPTRAVIFDSGAGQWVQLHTIRRAHCIGVTAGSPT